MVRMFPTLVIQVPLKVLLYNLITIWYNHIPYSKGWKKGTPKFLKV